MTRMQPHDRTWLVSVAWWRYDVSTWLARPSCSGKLASRAAVSAAGGGAALTCGRAAQLVTQLGQLAELLRPPPAGADAPVAAPRAGPARPSAAPPPRAGPAADRAAAAAERGAGAADGDGEAAEGAAELDAKRRRGGGGGFGAGRARRLGAKRELASLLLGARGTPAVPGAVCLQAYSLAPQ